MVGGPIASKATQSAGVRKECSRRGFGRDSLARNDAAHPRGRGLELANTRVLATISSPFTSTCTNSRCSCAELCVMGGGFASFTASTSISNLPSKSSGDTPPCEYDRPALTAIAYTAKRIRSRTTSSSAPERQRAKLAAALWAPLGRTGVLEALNLGGARSPTSWRIRVPSN